MATKKKEETPVFSKGDLIAKAGTFNTKPELLAGALHDVKEPITKEEAAKKLAAFLKKGVK